MIKNAALDKNRLVRVAWVDSATTQYEARLQIRSLNKRGLRQDMDSMFKDLEIKMSTVDAHTLQNGTLFITPTLIVKNAKELNDIIHHLERREDIIEVFRVGM